MSVTSAQTGLGATFHVGNASGGGSTTYTPVGEITSIKSPAITREAIDASHLNSPDETREYIAGMLNVEAATIGFNYVPNAADPLVTAIRAGAGDFRIVHKNGAQVDFSGIPTNWDPGETSADKMAGSFTVQPSGQPAFT